MENPVQTAKIGTKIKDQAAHGHQVIPTTSSKPTQSFLKTRHKLSKIN